MSLAAYRRMDDLGRAVGPPHSHHRAVQVQRLWNIHYPQLHCHIPRDAQHQQQWFQWANSLQQDAFYFASAMRQAGLLHPVVHRLHSVLVQYPPDNATDDSWMANETLVLEALGRWSSYMRTFLPSDHFSPANQHLRVGQRWANERGVPFIATIYTNMEQMEGREVVVSATYGINFYWI
ncbi:hypothetical protein DM01DRAFT_1331787 [Hesseltinella vesiculosa]|uniref:Uncharacterized protein n=1 Tax=Hesseltinella vesiculosa TaxID=101127 RepID=A0A1X2GWC5_9FUNG|nr:hypothetical protein DM01DRAFT_1331787 [Hesseltinella vesiculosa]